MTIRTQNRTPNRFRRRLRVESLEDRRLLAAGDLDLTFGVDGKVTTDFGGNEYGQAVAVQSDGKIVVAGRGREHGGENHFVLARYNADGSLDTSFDNDGRVTTDFGVSSYAQDVAIDPDGKIVAAGTADGNFAVARFNDDGSLDTSFGVGGTVVTDLLEFDVARGIAIDGNQIVVVGSTADLSFSTFDSDFALVRYNGDGSLDTTFGSGGVAIHDFSSFNRARDGASDVIISENGELLVSGWIGNGDEVDDFGLPGSDFGLARFLSDGSLDSTFGTEGFVTTSVAESDIPSAMAVDADGNILVVGNAFPSSNTSNPTNALFRYDSNGDLDSSFGIGGKRIIDFGGISDRSNDVAIDDSGNILVAGWARFEGSTTGSNFILAQYQNDGSPDPFFGTAGKVSTDFGFTAGANAMAIDQDGQVVLAGDAFSQNTWDFALARYDASPDAQTVQIDVKPGSDDNPVNLNSNGVISVAVLTTPDFDAASVDASTVIFANASAVHHALEDVDGDGDLDLLLHFHVEDTNLDALYAQYLLDDEDEDGVLDSTNAELEVTLRGLTLDNTLIQGSDDVDVFLRGKNLRDLLDELFG